MFNVFICDDSKLDIENIKNCLSVFSKKKHVDFNISEFWMGLNLPIKSENIQKHL